MENSSALMQVLESDLQTANSWGGGAARPSWEKRRDVQTPQREEGQAWGTWEDKGPVWTPYKSAAMGMWVQRVGAGFTLHPLTSCWFWGHSDRLNCHVRTVPLMDKLGSDG